VQPFEHIKGSFPAAGVYMYSFCLKPDEIVQPSGSCNMSRIDNASLIVTTKAGSVAFNDEANILDENMTLANVEGNLTSLLVFAESMNVLRILSGTLLYPYISSLLKPNHEECILTLNQFVIDTGMGGLAYSS